MFVAVDDWSKMPKEKNADEYEKDVKPRDILQFENMIHNSLPNWSAVWHMMARASAEKKYQKPDKRIIKSDDRKTFALERKIQKKVYELLNAEKTLVDLYKEAADVARVKQVQFKDKSDLLLRQIEKDKHLLRTLNAII